MKETALVIMAAGIGSRYGKGIKQLAKVGPKGEIIMDYSIYDALKAGFDKVIFIIRKDIEAEFREVIGDRIEKHVKVGYAFQDLHDLPEGYEVPDGRTKPWGTAQAVLCAKELIDCPFAVINADDFYGADGFKKVHDYLANEMDEESEVLDMCMAGFILGNTLSKNGTVARGVCKANEATGELISVTETYDIAERDGSITGRDRFGNEVQLSSSDRVSMNMWGLPRKILDVLSEEFPKFLDGVPEGDLKAEYLLPNVIDSLIKSGRAKVRLLETSDKWYGMTYAEDRQYVEDAIREMTDKGIYKEELFGFTERT